MTVLYTLYQGLDIEDKYELFRDDDLWEKHIDAIDLIMKKDFKEIEFLPTFHDDVRRLQAKYGIDAEMGFIYDETIIAI